MIVCVIIMAGFVKGIDDFISYSELILIMSLITVPLTFGKQKIVFILKINSKK